jgi:isoleucyl-tRNA synthetase
VLYDILKGFVVAVAPILSFTCEEIWQALPEGFKEPGHKSIFQASWAKGSVLSNDALSQEWLDIFSSKKAVLKSLEGLRQTKAIGSSLEAEVELYVDNEKVKTHLGKHLENLRYYFLVSKVTLKNGTAPEGAVEAEEARLKLKTLARKSIGQKCARCWNYYESSEMDGQDPEICHRCGPIVRHLNPAGSPP